MVRTGALAIVMEFVVTGPIRLGENGSEITPTGGLQHTLLAVLLASGNVAVVRCALVNPHRFERLVDRGCGLRQLDPMVAASTIFFALDLYRGVPCGEIDSPLTGARSNGFGNDGR